MMTIILATATVTTVVVGLGLSSWLAYKGGAAELERYQAAAAAATPPDPAAFVAATKECAEQAAMTQVALVNYPILHPEGAQLKKNVLEAYTHVERSMTKAMPGEPHPGSAAVDAANALAEWLASNPDPMYARAALSAQYAAKGMTKAVQGVDRAAGTPPPDFPWVELIGAGTCAALGAVATVAVVGVVGWWAWKYWTTPPPPPPPAPPPPPPPPPPPLPDPPLVQPYTLDPEPPFSPEQTFDLALLPPAFLWFVAFLTFILGLYIAARYYWR